MVKFIREARVYFASNVWTLNLYFKQFILFILLLSSFWKTFYPPLNDFLCPVDFINSITLEDQSSKFFTLYEYKNHEKRFPL